MANLTQAEKMILLRLAREALETAVRGDILPPLPASLPPALREPGASFVTLTIGGELRGCIGVLEAYQPLAEDVREHAIAAGLNDFRFPQVEPRELARIQVEVSRLTQPQPLEYTDSDDLLEKLRPGVDGVILKRRASRATFLPQVWEKLPEKADFLSHLCLKMGAPADVWRTTKLEVYTYQVEKFHE
jgi:hypothetical protein